MHGLFMPSAAFFRNTTTLKKMAPSRAKTRLGTVPESRALNPFVSFEERQVVKVSVADNCAYKDRGRGLAEVERSKNSSAVLLRPIASGRSIPPDLGRRSPTLSSPSFQEYFFAAVYYESLMNTISAPLNMPPRYAEFSKGRVLVGFNTSSQNMDTPWLRDDRENVAIASDYWDNPAASDELGKELKDTFHEVRAFGGGGEDLRLNHAYIVT